MDETRYPLCWPAGWQRSKVRTRAAFNRRPTPENPDQVPRRYSLTVWEAVARLELELRALYVPESSRIISTNIPTRNDGVPRSDRAEPKDPGVAVYWTSKAGKKQCMAIDRYDRVADNLAAVAATLEALRAIERHGGGAILDRAFAGFAQLTEGTSPRPWREVLMFSETEMVSREMVIDHFRKIAPGVHPDLKGGSHDKMAELNVARDRALAEIGA